MKYGIELHEGVKKGGINKPTMVKRLPAPLPMGDNMSVPREEDKLELRVFALEEEVKELKKILANYIKKEELAAIKTSIKYEGE